jgi:dUTP pyrophosphatase
MIGELLKTDPPLIEGMPHPDQALQPNGVDLSLMSVAHIRSAGCLGVQAEDRVLPDLAPQEFTDGWVCLPHGEYLITFNEIVHLPLHIMALGRPRSSLLRMAVSIGTAVWDAGYHGRSQSLLVVYNSHGVRLEKNSRLMQLVFFTVEGGPVLTMVSFKMKTLICKGSERTCYED